MCKSLELLINGLSANDKEQEIYKAENSTTANWSKNMNLALHGNSSKRL